MLLKETKANLSLLFRFISQTCFPICVDKCWSDFITIFRCSAMPNTKYELSFLEIVLKTLCTRNPFVQLGERMRPEPAACPGCAGAAEPWQCQQVSWAQRGAQTLDELPGAGSGSLEVDAQRQCALGWCSLPASAARGGHGAGDTWLDVVGNPAQPRAHLCSAVLIAPFSQAFTSSSLLGNPCPCVFPTWELQGEI